MYRRAALALSLAALLPVATDAQLVRRPLPAPMQRPLPANAQRPLARASLSPYAHPRVAHVVYGVIASVGGTSLVLRMRRGQMLRVDDSAAVRDGTYSAPLFVGKYVVVEGEVGPDGVLYAARVSRLTRIDEATGPDH